MLGRVDQIQSNPTSYVEHLNVSINWQGLWRIIKIGEETKEGNNLIEARVKLRYNYSGFLAANIKIFDRKETNSSYKS